MQSDKYKDWSIMRGDSIKNLAKEVYNCEKCEDLGVKRIPDKGLVPEFMVGNFEAKIWIVGLNPKLRKRQDGIMDPKDSKKFDRYFKRIPNFDDFGYSYFKRIKDHVFLEDWEWGRDVAYVDLVKCASREIDKSFEKAKDNCGDYLERQIKLLKPKLIIANGIAVSKWFKSQKEQKNVTNTSILLKFNGFETIVVLSGFIGRMDRCSMARLREDIKRIKKNGYM
jgi:uracil-DNA glycosylase